MKFYIDRKKFKMLHKTYLLSLVPDFYYSSGRYRTVGDGKAEELGGSMCLCGRTAVLRGRQQPRGVGCGGMRFM